MKRYSQVTFALLLGLTAKGFAQGNYYSQGPVVQGQVEAGGALSTGDSSQFLDNGFTLGGGVLFHPTPGPLAFRATFDYTRLDATRELVEQASAAAQTNFRHGQAEIYSLRVNALLEAPVSRYTRAYITAGIGGANERLSLDRRYGRPVSGNHYFPDAFAGHRDDEQFTYNVGAGLSFSQGGWESFFVEAAYEHVDTPQATTFVPIRVGVRF
jgi:opacity protein-like surface antigen